MNILPISNTQNKSNKQSFSAHLTYDSKVSEGANFLSWLGKRSLARAQRKIARLSPGSYVRIDSKIAKGDENYTTYTAFFTPKGGKQTDEKQIKQLSFYSLPGFLRQVAKELKQMEKAGNN